MTNMSPYQSFIHRSRYARWLETEGRRETWEETVHRYITFFEKRIPKADKEIVKKLEQAILDMKVMPSMRAMMTAGPALDKDHCAGYNCSYIAIDDPRAFDEAMYLSMCGVGVGFSVERQYVNQMPTVAENFYPTGTVIRVKDSKIGWASAFKEIIQLLYAGLIPKWDVSEVRPKGALLKTFGGRASGPEPLEDLFRFCISTFQKSAGRKLTSIECHDIMCKIADVVVSGGVRRSAMISLSNLSDDRMRAAKTGQWWDGNVQRALANNSAVYTEKPDIGIFMKEWISLYESKSGERGIFNRTAATLQAKATARRKWEGYEFGTNPSLRRGTRVWTADGIFPIDQLEGKEFLVKNLNGQESPAKCWLSGKNKKLWKVSLTGDVEYFSTAEHRWPVLTDYGIIKTTTKDLNKGDYLPLACQQTSLTNGTVGDYKDGFVVGWNLGDGWITEKFEGQQIGFMVSKEDRQFGIDTILEDYLRERCDWTGTLKNKDEINVNNSKLRKKFTQFCVTNKAIGLPSIVWTTASEEFRRGLIDGLFSSDGHTDGRHVGLSTSHRQLALDVADLLGFYGLKTRITHATSASASFPNGKTYDRSYERFGVNVDQTFTPHFVKLFTLTHSRKQQSVEAIASSLKRPLMVDCIRILSIEETDIFEDVWDIAVADDTHCFQLAHCITGNCGEIILRSKGFCNLTEVVVREQDDLASLKEKVELAVILGTLQSTLTSFRYLRRDWQKNAEEERLLGVSLTGIMDNVIMAAYDLAKGGLGAWLLVLRNHAISTNAIWAEKLGIEPAAAITCVKPSGTVSQLVDCSPGIHTRWSKYLMKAVRNDRKDPLGALLKDCGVPNEPDVTKENDVDIFYFPLKSPEKSITRNSLNALDQLEIYLIYKRNWCEHNPSCTIYVKESEWLQVGAWVYKHFDEIGGISFLPHSEHVYRQAPLTELTKEEYDKAVASFPAIDWARLSEFETSNCTTSSHELACSAGSCDITMPSTSWTPTPTVENVSEVSA